MQCRYHLFHFPRKIASWPSLQGQIGKEASIELAELLDMAQTYIYGKEVSQPYEHGEWNTHRDYKKWSRSDEHRWDARFFQHNQVPRKVQTEDRIAAYEDHCSKTDFSSDSEGEDELFSSCSPEEILVAMEQGLRFFLELQHYSGKKPKSFLPVSQWLRALDSIVVLFVPSSVIIYGNGTLNNSL